VDCSARMATSVGVGPLRALTVSSFVEKTSIGSKPVALRKPFQGSHGFALPSLTSRRGQFASFRIRAEVTDSGSEDGSGASTATKSAEKSEVDKLIEGMSFGQLCDEFECISSPAVEKTARQLVKDIMSVREDKRSLGNFGMNVVYKDPLRSFKGREKYKRATWIKTALEKPTVAVQEMKMLTTSVLNIKWTLRGKPKLPPASALGGEVVLSVNSVFTLNQISGQVVEHEDEWDLSASDPLAQAYFWTTRLAFSTIEAGKDSAEKVKGMTNALDKGKDNDKNSYYPDPSGDPRKFFQVEDNPQKDLYQVGFVIALIYLLVQFLRQVL